VSSSAEHVSEAAGLKILRNLRDSKRFTCRIGKVYYDAEIARKAEPPQNSSLEASRFLFVLTIFNFYASFESEPNKNNTMALFHRDPLLDDSFGAPAPSSWAYRRAHSGMPAHHLYETETSVQLSVDVPGIKAKDLSVKVENNVLQVSGERKTSGRESKFVRSFAIDPTIVNVSLVEANLDCGVLTLTVPKKTKPVTSKSIAVTETATPESQPDVVTT
jgi:HSP20 family protein